MAMNALFADLAHYLYLCRLMKTQFLIPLLTLLAAPAAGAASLQFVGSDAAPVEIAPEASSGLEAVYVLRHTAGVRVVYPSATARWSIFSAAGAAYASPIESQVSGNESSIDLNSTVPAGFLIEDGGRQYCFWIIDYSDYDFALNSVNVDNDEFDCDFIAFSIDGAAPPMYYYSINGRRIELDRQIEVAYNTLVFDTDMQQYRQAAYSTTLPSINGTMHVAAPLCDTHISVSGDIFLRAWGEEQHAESAEYRAQSVAAVTRAEQQERDVPNEQNPGAENLGGSAPCTITFTAETTDAVAFTEWQFSRTPDFDILENSFNDRVVEHTFTENGTMYARFTCANADGTCSYTTDTYMVSIGESILQCPNAFTPDTSPGVNDEWRVSYQSIIEFHCDIFNRWGTKLATLTHPSQGWDGKHGGKSVGPGVYYYVIRARGADGKDYKMSGDINIIGSRQRGGYGNGSASE